MFKQEKNILVILSILSLFIFTNAIETIETTTINDKKVNIVILPSSEYEFRVGKAHGGKSGSQPFRSMIDDYKPAAAINANYFNAYTKSEDEKVPYGTIVKNGKIITFGPGASFIASDEDVKIKKIQWLDQHTHFKNLAHSDDIEKNVRYTEKDYPQHIIEEYVETIVSGNPILVKDGKNVAAEDSAGMNSDISVRPAQRCAIGITKDKKVVFLTAESVTVVELADIFLSLNCTDAMNFDGGASTALYADGKTLHSPGRKLNTILMAYKKKSYVEATKDNLTISVEKKDKEQKETIPFYTINQSIYISINDLALVLQGSKKEFNIKHLQEGYETHLILGESYTKKGDEFEAPEGKYVVAKLSREGFFLDKESIAIKAYEINKKNYFKLDTLVKILNLKARWTSEGINIS